MNEGANSSDAKLDVNCLGVEMLQAGQEFSTNWLAFDKQQGKEKLWLVWSAAPLPMLEALKKWITPVLRGAMGDPVEAKAVLAFLKSAPQAERTEAEGLSALKTSGDVLVRLIPLDHQ